jgi:DNA-directed RNA polymerase specialized sigma subunit
MKSNEKKYRYPIEMDKEYAKKLGIDPREITYIMLDGKLTQVYFVEIEDELLYHERMRQIWKDEKAFQRSKRCAVSNKKGKLVRCNGNCAVCSFNKSGTPLSLDMMVEKGSLQVYATYDPSVEEIVERKILMELLWGQIKGLSEVDQTIIIMFINYATEKEIAQAVGMKQTTVSYHIRRILKILKKSFEDFC